MAVVRSQQVPSGQATVDLERIELGRIDYEAAGKDKRVRCPDVVRNDLRLARKLSAGEQQGFAVIETVHVGERCVQARAELRRCWIGIRDQSDGDGGRRREGPNEDAGRVEHVVVLQRRIDVIDIQKIVEIERRQIAWLDADQAELTCFQLAVSSAGKVVRAEDVRIVGELGRGAV